MNELLCPGCNVLNAGENAQCYKCGEQLHFAPPVYAEDSSIQDAPVEAESARPEEDTSLFGPSVIGVILGTLMAVQQHAARTADKRVRLQDELNKFDADKKAHGGVGKGETDPNTGVTRYL